MKHIHKKTGYEFEVGEYCDGDKTYDITIISYWKSAEEECKGSPVELVGYYFGGYDEAITDVYIERWLDERAKETRTLKVALDVMNAYLLTNSEFLEPNTNSRIMQACADCHELISTRDWLPEAKHPREWHEAEAIKKILNDCMADPGDTSIKITICRDGKEVTADLYDHAALVTSLYETLDYFQSEL